MRPRFGKGYAFVLTCGCLLAWAPAPAASGDKPTAEEKAAKDKAEQMKIAGESVERMATAYKLVEYGRTTKSPEALITAASLLKRIPPPSALQAERENEKQAPPMKELPSLKDEAAKLLDEAKKMSDNDAHIVAVADRVAKRDDLKRGALGGPQILTKQLAENSYDSYTVKFMPGTPVQIVATSSRADIPIRLRVSYSANGNHLTVGEYDGVVGRAVFAVPASKKPIVVYISVHNRTDGPTVYKLITN